MQPLAVEPKKRPKKINKVDPAPDKQGEVEYAIPAESEVVPPLAVEPLQINKVDPAPDKQGEVECADGSEEVVPPLAVEPKKRPKKINKVAIQDDSEVAPLAVAVKETKRKPKKINKVDPSPDKKGEVECEIQDDSGAKPTKMKKPVTDIAEDPKCIVEVILPAEEIAAVQDSANSLHSETYEQIMLSEVFVDNVLLFWVDNTTDQWYDLELNPIDKPDL